MLRRQGGWVPALAHNPLYGRYLAAFIAENPTTEALFATLGLSAEGTAVLPRLETRGGRTRAVSELLAMRATVPAAACDPFLGPDLLRGASAPAGLAFSAGLASALGDSVNSVQIMERLMPAFNVHVSVVLRTHNHTAASTTTTAAAAPPPLTPGEELVVISRIDRIGKRMAYCRADIYRDRAEVPPAVAEAEARVRGAADLEAVLAAHYERCFSVSHVKSILERQIEREGGVKI